MFGIGLNLKSRVSGGAQVVGYYTLSSSRYVSAIQIVVKSDTDECKEMIRLIPVYEQQLAGTYPIVWDGLDYLGNNVIATNDYEANVLHSNITYDYYIIGSNSTLKHGPSTFRGYSPNIGIFWAGNKTYLNHSWDEGQNIKGAYVDKSVDIKTQLNLGYGGTTRFSGAAFEYGCKVPGKDIVILGGENSAQGYEGDNIIYAYNSSTDAALTFANGSTYNAGLTSYSVLYQGAEKISGITASNGFCYVTFDATDTVRIYRIGTTGSPDGTLERTDTTTTIDASWDAPIVFAQSFDNSGSGERIWAMNKTTSQVFKLTVNGTTGALTSGALTTNFGSGYKVALAVNNTDHTLAVIIGVGYQQIRFFDISAANPSGSSFQTFGTAGGMEQGNANCSVVTNTKFVFWDNSTGIDKGTQRGFIGWSEDGEFWVGDTGNERTLRFTYTYSSTYSFTYVDQIDQIGAVYNNTINLTDPTEVYIKGKRYTVDLTTGAYTLTHNYLPQMSFNNINGRDMIFKVTNYSTVDGVKKIAILLDYSTLPPAPTYPLVQFTDDGIVPLLANMADTGMYLLPSLDENFTLTQIYSASYAVGQQPIIRQKYLNYSSPNFSLSGYTTITTLDPIISGGIETENGNTSFSGLLGSGNILLGNVNKDSNVDFQIELSNSSGVKKWRSVTKTSRIDEGGAGYTGHQGQIPPPNWLEAANGVNDIADRMWGKGDFWAFTANYEDYKGKQGNYLYLGHKIGIPIKLIGTNRWKSEAIEDHGIEADGNCQFFEAVYADSDTLVVVASSEGGHAGSQLRVIKGLSGITIAKVNVAPPTYETVRGTRQLLELSAVDIFSNTTYLALSEAQSANFKVETNIMWADREKPDLHIYSVAGGNNTRYVRDTIHPTRDASLKHWELAFNLNFMGHAASESTSFPGAFVRILDNSSKVIALLGIGLVGSTYSVFANNTVIFSTTDANDLNNYLFDFNEGLIKTNSLGCEITFGNEPTVYVAYYDPTCTWNNPTYIDLGCETKTGGSGTGSISARQELDYYDTQVADAAPILLSAETITSTQVRLTFDSAVDASILGFSLTEDGSSLAISSISGGYNLCDLTVASMSVGTDLLLNYNSSTGDTVNADNVELVTFSNYLVTNNVVPVSFSVTHNSTFGGNGFNLDYSSSAFTTVSGQTIDVPIWTFFYSAVITSVTDLAGNTYTKIADDVFGHCVWRSENVGAYTNNIVTINLSGYGSAGAHVIVSTGLVTSSSVESPVDIATSAGNTTVTSGTITTAQANEVLFAYSYGGTPWTPPTGFTDLGTDANNRVNASYKVLNVTFSGTITSTTVGDTTDKTLITVKSKLA
jgi:hypothetical protein